MCLMCISDVDSLLSVMILAQFFIKTLVAVKFQRRVDDSYYICMRIIIVWRQTDK